MPKMGYSRHSDGLHKSSKIARVCLKLGQEARSKFPGQSTQATKAIVTISDLYLVGCCRAKPTEVMLQNTGRLRRPGPPIRHQSLVAPPPGVNLEKSLAI